jgi:hypothetical protein
MAEELQKTITDRQVGSILKNLLDIQIFLKLKAEKQRDQLKEKKKKAGELHCRSLEASNS